jgi:hypothetical protein
VDGSKDTNRVKLGPVSGKVEKYKRRKVRKTGARQAVFMQIVPAGNVTILEGHYIGHSKYHTVYVHVSYSERFL